MEVEEPFVEEPFVENMLEEAAIDSWLDWHYYGESEGLDGYLELSNSPLPLEQFFNEAVTFYYSTLAIDVLVKHGLKLHQQLIVAPDSAEYLHPYVWVLRYMPERFRMDFVKKLMELEVDFYSIKVVILVDRLIDKNHDAFLLLKHEITKRDRRMRQILGIRDQN